MTHNLVNLFLQIVVIGVLAMILCEIPFFNEFKRIIRMLAGLVIFILVVRFLLPLAGL